jgi:hypothetical protein
MAKNQFQDIKKVETYNQNKIPKRDYIPPEVSRILQKESTNPNNLKVSKSRQSIWIVALMSVIFLFFALSFLFSKATISVTPKIKAISLNQNMSGVKDPNTEKMPFDLITLSDQESKSILSGEEKDFKESAKGKVLIYNKYSSAPQPLLVDTRLEGSNGKIYKTKSKVTVPGMSKDGIPGKISVDIYAIEDGSEYNSPPIDFKILGFKGTPKYSKFEGRSVGEISGGILGKSRQITEEQKMNAEKELKENLEIKLFAKAVSQIPEGFVLFKDAAVLKIDDTLVSDISSDGLVTITVKGTLNGFILDEGKLTKKIIESILPEDSKGDVYISNIKDLTFNIKNKQSIVFSDVTNIDFNIYGVPKVVYKIDSNELASIFLGKNKKDFDKILLQFPNIDKAELLIKPIWKSTFPEKIEKLKIIINYP